MTSIGTYVRDDVHLTLARAWSGCVKLNLRILLDLLTSSNVDRCPHGDASFFELCQIGRKSGAGRYGWALVLSRSPVEGSHAE